MDVFMDIRLSWHSKKCSWTAFSNDLVNANLWAWWVVANSNSQRWHTRRSHHALSWRSFLEPSVQLQHLPQYLTWGNLLCQAGRCPQSREIFDVGTWSFEQCSFFRTCRLFRRGAIIGQQHAKLYNGLIWYWPGKITPNVSCIEEASVNVCGRSRGNVTVRVPIHVCHCCSFTQPIIVWILDDA
jgi:hypothetical protein